MLVLSIILLVSLVLFTFISFYFSVLLFKKVVKGSKMLAW